MLSGYADVMSFLMVHAASYSVLPCCLIYQRISELIRLRYESQYTNLVLVSIFLSVIHHKLHLARGEGFSDNMHKSKFRLFF